MSAAANLWNKVELLDLHPGLCFGKRLYGGPSAFERSLV